MDPSPVLPQHPASVELPVTSLLWTLVHPEHVIEVGLHAGMRFSHVFHSRKDGVRVFGTVSALGDAVGSFVMLSQF